MINNKKLALRFGILFYYLAHWFRHKEPLINIHQHMFYPQQGLTDVVPNPGLVHQFHLELVMAYHVLFGKGESIMCYIQSYQERLVI